MPGDAASAAIATKDIVTWFVGGVGILASLGWNFFNFRATFALQQRTVRLGEFQRVREPIDEGLRTLREDRRDLDLAIKNSLNLIDVRQRVQAYNKARPEAFDKLSLALSDANISRNVIGDDWDVVPSRLFDEHLELLNIVYADSATLPGTIDQLDNAVKKLAEIERVIMQRLDDELARYGGQPSM